MGNNLVCAIIAIISLVILDMVWFFFNGKMYKDIVRKVQDTELKVNIYAAMLVYIFIFLAFYVLIFPFLHRDSSNNKFKLAFRYGALFGFIVYGIYNTTNIVFFQKYSYHTAVIDTLWGGVAFFISVLIALYLKESLKI